MEAQQFHLKWNNHSLNTLNSFQHLLDTHTLVDVSLTCNNGKTLSAHRMVLAACSEYFYRLFKDLPEKHPVIVFKDASEDIVRDLLLFMYKGEVEVREAILSDFLKFAETLQVKGLSSSDKDGNKIQSTPPLNKVLHNSNNNINSVGPNSNVINNSNNNSNNVLNSSSNSNQMNSSSNKSSLPPSSNGSPIPVPPPTSPTADLMTKNYLLAAAAGKLSTPPLFPPLPPSSNWR
ncbi:Longitudinals lacking protein-like [Lepeophtheirus salmonis]|uniref:Longitudinals lacking protein-like n=1 Tax=Lepeophtheirus salmonis TaxID=72036 RepID=A0A7R8GYW5_LEPSM|nr:Longitudinals lacking protein-like [Lepeophtheirus salmonis]CAF2754894.1 Longitudinals lacking protein-like [Lepeophtheirus salmonis]